MSAGGVLDAVPFAQEIEPKWNRENDKAAEENQEQKKNWEKNKWECSRNRWEHCTDTNTHVHGFIYLNGAKKRKRKKITVQLLAHAHRENQWKCKRCQHKSIAFWSLTMLHSYWSFSYCSIPAAITALPILENADALQCGCASAAYGTTWIGSCSMCAVSFYSYCTGK